MKVPKLNERLIGKVLAHIKAFPGSYDQNDVASSCDVSKETPCGAIGCFGGWAVLLSNPKTKRHDLAEEGYVDLGEAEELVGFTSEEANFVFESASGDPKDDYKTVVSRLNEVRRARKLIAPLLKLPNSVDVTSVQISVEDRNGDSRTLIYQ
jgi:hypothetical protein